MEDVYHVLPHTKGWAIIKGKNKRVSAFANTMRMAEKIANQLAKKYAKAVAIHDKDGRLINFIKINHE